MSTSSRINTAKQRVERHQANSRTGRRREVSAFPRIECLEERTLLSWVPVANLPTPRFGLAATLGRDGLIYALGGTDAQNNQLFAVDAYRVTGNNWAARAPLITHESQ